jgi:hypothetical protein
VDHHFDSGVVEEVCADREDMATLETELEMEDSFA